MGTEQATDTSTSWKALEQRVKAQQDAETGRDVSPGSPSIRSTTSTEFDTKVESMHQKVMGSSSGGNTSNTALSDLSTTTKGDKATNFTRRRFIKRCLVGFVGLTCLAFMCFGIVIFAMDIRSQRQYGSQTKPAGQDPQHDHFDGTYSTNASPQRPTSIMAGLRNSLGLSSDQDTFESEHEHIAIYDHLHNVVSPTEPYDPATQIPFLWSPGAPNFIADEMLKCFPLTQASWVVSRVGRRHEGAIDSDFQVLPGKPDEKGSYLDVDMATLHGLKRATDFFLFDRHLADYVASPFLPEVLEMFPESHKGRIVTMLMDPIARVKASYNHLSQNSYITGSLLEFASSNHLLANDYTVRTLTGKWDVSIPLGPADVNQALEVLRTKFHAGVMRYYKEWMVSVIQTFQWGGMDAFSCLWPEEQRDVTPPPPPDQLEIQIRTFIEKHNHYDKMLLLAVSSQWEHYHGGPNTPAELGYNDQVQEQAQQQRQHEGAAQQQQAQQQQ